MDLVPEVISSHWQTSEKAKAAAWPSLSFYPSMLRITWKCARSVNPQGHLSDADWSLASRGNLQALIRVGCSADIQGLEHVAQLKSPFVLVANHMSTLETYVLPFMLIPHRRPTFVVKEALTKMKVFGTIMKGTEAIAVSRNNPRKDLTTVFTEGKKQLDAGKCVVIFPQTTRSITFQKGQFSSIAAKLAKKADVPLVPLALDSRAWGNGKKLKDFGPIKPEHPIRFCFGPPLPPTPDAHQKSQEFITTWLKEWGVPIGS